MTGTSTTQKAIAPAATTAAVLYVCAERSTTAPSLAEERARGEGVAFAQDHGLSVVTVVTDPFGEPDPMDRPGWRRVRAMAEAGEVSTVIVRWPAALAPESRHEIRYREIAALGADGVDLRFSWPPLASIGAEGR